MGNPYTGLTLEQLQERKASLLDFCEGKGLRQFGGQGSSFTRGTITVSEARQQIALIDAAIADLANGTTPITRTVGTHWHDYTR